MNNKDINGSVPQCVKFKTQRGAYNPLEPKYNLPKYEEIPPPINKFIRDSINIDDIDGSRPKRNFKWKNNFDFVHPDIEGSKPRKPKCRKSDYDSFNYSDVTNFKFISTRKINPLDPEYTVDYGKGEKYLHGKIEGSKPVTFHPMIYPDPLNMKTADVPGAQIGSKNKFNKFTSMNHNLILKDIDKAQSDSLKKGITTFRKTNPLNPDYKVPGHLENAKHNNPYADTLYSKPKPKTTQTRTPGELAIKNRVDKMKKNMMNNPVNGRIE
jgi:hypothetical protein